MSTHDPLCDIQRETYCIWPGDKCARCHLIARVRADERARWQPPLPMTAGHVAACFCPSCFDGGTT